MPSDSVIRILCPNISCQRVLAVPTEVRGKIVRCSQCGAKVRIPMAKSGQSSARARRDDHE